MKALIFTQYFWPEDFRINDIVIELQKKGIESAVLTGKPNYPLGKIFTGYRMLGCLQESYLGIPIYRIPLFPRGRGAWRLAINYISFIISGLLFAPWLLRRKDIDVIFVYAPSPILQAIPAIFLGWLKGCPVVLWVQDLWPDSLSATGYVKSPSVLKMIEYLVGWIYRKVELLLVQSPAFIPKVSSVPGAAPIAYYPNSFVGNAPRKINKKIDCLEFDCAFPVLFAGNIGSAQAIEVILEAATILRDVEGVRFIMVGDGSRRDWLMEQSADRGLNNLFFSGRYPVELMPALMEKASALLVTLADTEIFRLTIPSKIQAYLAAGRPIIACLNGVGAEIIHEAGAGMTVPAEDSNLLAQAVMDLFSTPESERLDMGFRGRRYYEEHFSQDKLVDELIGHLDQVVRQHKGHA